MKLALGILAFAFISHTSAAQAPRGSGARGERSAINSGGLLRLYPKFAPGETRYYQLDFRSRMSGNTVGLIVDPQAVKDMDVSMSSLLQLNTLNVKESAGAAGPRPALRLRATYTKVATTIRADVPDPQVDGLRDMLQKLEQKSVEFTIESNGRVTNVAGFDDLLPADLQAIQNWISQIGLAAALPQDGIRMGQKWEATLPVSLEVPLAGIAWRLESTYLRDEPCHTEGKMQAAAANASQAEECAVILSTVTSMETSRKTDRTPEEFRKKNLRTEGVFKSQGQTLTYISLKTGLVVSSTQTSEQEMNITITSLAVRSSYHHTGRVQTQSQLSLVDGPSAPGPE